MTKETNLTRWLSGLKLEASILDAIWKYEIGLGVMLLAGGGVWGYMKDSWFLLGVGVLLVFFGISHGKKRGETKQNIGFIKFGAKGEEQVSDLLQAKLPDTYLIFNDIDVASGTRKAQNDHIVLGPNGIFVIETKAYSGRITGNADDEKITQTKTYKGKTTTKMTTNPVSQNERHCSVVGDLLKARGFVTDDIYSIIVFTNKWAKIEIKGTEVPVIKPDFLEKTILNQTSNYSYDENYLRHLAHVFAPGSKVPPAK